MAVLTTVLGFLGQATMYLGYGMLTATVVASYARLGYRIGVSPTAKFFATLAPVAIVWDAVLTSESGPLGGERRFGWLDLGGSVVVTAVIRGLL